MNEMTIAQPLSGTEVVTRIVEKVRTMLRQDCFLNDYAAYESFEADIKIVWKCKDIGRIADGTTHVTERSENPVDPNDDNFALEIAEESIGAMPPNQVRMESGQPIPTLVDTGDGKQEVKHVKYAKKPAGQQKSESEI
jgi:hypothetical protein